MKIKLLSGADLFIEFRYEFDTLEKGDKEKRLIGTQVSVELSESDGSRKVFTGHATLHPKEAPVRSTGRKIALRYAMKEAHFSLEERFHIWKELIKQGMKIKSGVIIKVPEKSLRTIANALQIGYDRINSGGPCPQTLLFQESKEVGKAIHIINKLVSKNTFEVPKIRRSFRSGNL